MNNSTFTGRFSTYETESENLPTTDANFRHNVNMSKNKYTSAAFKTKKILVIRLKKTNIYKSKCQLLTAMSHNYYSLVSQDYQNNVRVTQRCDSFE